MVFKVLLPIAVLGVLYMYFNNFFHFLKESPAFGVKDDAAHYKSLYDETSERNVELRFEKYSSIVPNFYRLVTRFYEYGWGESFHFAPRREGESFEQSLARHELSLALWMQLKPGMKVLDLGAGIGGPMREIARFANVSIVGVNIVDYQIERGNQLNKKYALDDTCSFVKADFMDLPFEDNSFDAIYSIEAVCHSLNKEKVYSEAYRVLKPGGRMAVIDWLMTDKYDSNNPDHVKIKEGIEIGNALPDIQHYSVVDKQVSSAGFKIIYQGDTVVPSKINPIPWYRPLQSAFSLRGVANSHYSRVITNYVTLVLEKFGLIDEGSHYTAVMLHKTALALVESGKSGIFTPSYLAVLEKEQK